MSDAFERAIARLTDGDPIDWPEHMAGAEDDRERRMLDELRALSTLLHEPARWRHLQLIEQIGAGAHGVVFRAHDPQLVRDVALKLLADDGSDRTIDEARRLARVTHPNVVTVYGADRADGLVGLWMERLTGRTLDAIVGSDGPFSAREATGIALDLCGAVATIHAAGLVHRDIKAQNVVREPGGRIVLMDLGISDNIPADDAIVDAVAGTPAYMAPELFDGKPATVGSDVYAIGVLLYRLVTGEFPADASTIGGLRQQHREGQLRPLRTVRPDLPSAFVRVVDCCLTHDASRRFRDVAALERALHDIESAGASRHRTSLLAIAPAFTLLLGAAMAWTYATRTSRQAGHDPMPTGLTGQQYAVFAGYEELAFARLADAPAAAAAAASGALSQLRSVLPGIQPLESLVDAQVAEARRREGNLVEAQRLLKNGAVGLLSTVGDDHPFSMVVAMEEARLAQAAGDYDTMAAQLRRALEIRWRVLGLSELSGGPRRLLDLATLAQAGRASSCTDDSDRDGLLDVFEVGAHLDPHAADSDGNGVSDDLADRDDDGVSNHLELGVGGHPFLTLAHFAALDPRALAWQVGAGYPLIDGPLPAAPVAAWSMTARQAMAYFTQRLSPEQSARAMERGFTLLARVQPGDGLTSLAVDLSPAPRFDLLLQRTGDDLEIRLPSSLVPREGPTIVVPVPSRRWLLLELRYDPAAGSAGAYVDGRLVRGGYAGFHQFQDSVGGMAWGVASIGSGDTKASAAFNLVWLEIR